MMTGEDFVANRLRAGSRREGHRQRPVTFPI
ncbi:MAG: hypothetical protein ACI9N0_003430, partial [Ilumatobacter sp.]